MKIVMLLFALTLAAACGTSRKTLPGGPDVELTQAQRKGLMAFMEYCNQCHPRGEAGLGPSLNNKPLPRALIELQVRDGLGAMPAFSNRELSEEELDRIVDYMLALRGA